MSTAENNHAILMTGNKVTRFAWPGGYPVFYVTHDGGALCPDCVNENREQCCDPYDRGWFVTSHAVNWEDSQLQCDHCGNHIESAYGGEA